MERRGLASSIEVEGHGGAGSIEFVERRGLASSIEVEENLFDISLVKIVWIERVA